MRELKWKWKKETRWLLKIQRGMNNSFTCMEGIRVVSFQLNILDRKEASIIQWMEHSFSFLMLPLS